MKVSLPKWPERVDLSHYRETGTLPPLHIHELYQYERAEAALARLRHALPFMKHDMICFQVPQEIGVMYRFIAGEPMKAVKCVCGLDAALAEIGPLPDQTTTPL